MYLEHFCSTDNGWKIPECFFACLDNFVTYAKELDLTVIFDFHNNTAVGTSTPENIEETLISIWTQMTERYKDSYEKNNFTRCQKSPLIQ